LSLLEQFSDVVALDFDLTCTYRLKLFDDAKEERLLEATTSGSLAGLVGKPKGPLIDRSKAERW
jgi:hypothetical protein